jgi:hypothetical protein
MYFTLYIYFSYQTRNTVVKYNPFFILLIRPDGGQSFLAETYRLILTEYNVALTDRNIRLTNINVGFIPNK